MHGVTRGSPSDIPSRLAHILNPAHPQRTAFSLHHCDILDVQAFATLLSQTQPCELYNLAAQSSVGVSFNQPLETVRVDGLGVLNVLETCRIVNKNIRVFLASSSEIFGRATVSPQDESTKPYPCSPYANAKLMSHTLARLYREAYKMYVCSGILYNHESCRRGHAFVTQKIVRGAVHIRHGLQQCLKLGNLNSGRDWGHADDFADCMWRMLQIERPDDFIVATGTSYTVREFAALAFLEVGIEICFTGKGLHEKGVVKSSGKTVIEVDPDFFRPMEPNMIIGNSEKAKTILSWNPTSTVPDLIREMVEACEAELLSGKVFEKQKH